MSTKEYHDFLVRARRRWADKLDLSEVEAAGQFLPYFHGPRVKVVTEYGDGERYERTGTVSVTTGWRPALLLIHRSSDTGSGDVLGPRDRIVAVQRGREYVPTRQTGAAS